MSGVSGTYARFPRTAGFAGNESARDPMDELKVTEFLVDKLRGTKNNADFFDSMRRGLKKYLPKCPDPGASA